MSMDQTTKYTVLRYLGWPIRTIDPVAMEYSNILTSKLNGFPDDAATLLTDLLDRIAEVDGQLKNMVARSNVQQVDDIHFFQDGSAPLRGERRRLIRELASLLDFPIGPGATGGNTFGVCI